MRVGNLGLRESPTGPARVRVTAEVSYDDRAAAAETYWFDVPDRCASELTTSGDPWLALFAPLAAHLGEPLHIDAPVDDKLLTNVHELMTVWRCWWGLRPVAVHASAASAPVAAAGRTGALFSGGVDAWATLLRHTVGSVAPRVDDCLTAWGLDITLANPAGFRRMHAAATRAAAELGVEAIDVATNLRERRWWWDCDWGRVSHGCALAAVGLVLGRRLKCLLIPSTYRYGDPVLWGSHPLTDRLLSTSALEVVHDGAGLGRTEKTRLLLDHQIALDTLQVCWETNSYENCGRCSKCLRTMMTLELLDGLVRCPTFPSSAVDLGALARILPHGDGGLAFHRELRALAVEKGRRDVVRVLDRGLAWHRTIELARRLLAHDSKRPAVRILQRQVRNLGRRLLDHRFSEW